ncbi:hypothetical protein JOF41_007334 [Saccharothrix coeruleofusca]|uniref:hypothetical protein n=1 Tax=Saccharothrix coeruleofusca TaxID=33919 RepID=UPI001AE3EA38|nr:hypothetical protein [Saccharothrix coeruleofusca]MBP2341080.1 hypothetical protein [Saccharothrix coeruleofusca]
MTATTPDITTHIRCLAADGHPHSLTTLRHQLAAYPRHLVDAALRTLASQDDVQLRSQEDQKRLTEDDRRAALMLGGTPRHLLHIT